MSQPPHLGTAPAMHTPRLHLRALSSTDDTFLHRLLRDSMQRAYLGGAIDDAQIPAHCARTHADALHAPHWTVLQAACPIGLVSLTPHKDGSDIELSYQFVSGATGQGLAFEATSAVLDYAKARGLTRIIAETQVANTRSVALLDRLGMRPERRLDRFGSPQVIYST